MAPRFRFFVAALCTTAMVLVFPGFSATAEGTPKMTGKPRLIYNLDYDALSGGFFGPVGPETIDACVDTLASSGVTDLFICINNQRVNYRSDAWEAVWDGLDPKGGDEQPFFADLPASDKATREFCRRFYGLHEQGCSYPERMLARAREKRMAGWITVRMNDCHYGGRPNHPYHSTFWRQHPEWYLGDGGGAGAELDYARPEVRQHYLALIREVCEGYNLDGLELDFMRFPVFFHPGQWRQGEAIMTGFVRQVRSITERAAKRLEHPVKLAVRVHVYPWTSRRMGLDAVTWAREELTDLVTVSPFYTTIQSDVPIETWRGLLADTKAEIALCLEGGIDSGAGGRRTPTPEEARGVSLSALYRGADSVYLFNWYGSPWNDWPRAEYTAFLKAARTYDGLAGLPRRHPVTTRDSFTAEGELAVPFSLPTQAARAVFRIHIGPKPTADQKAFVEILTDVDAAPTRVLLNGVECTPGSVEGLRRIYASPADTAGPGWNLVTVESGGNLALNWVEIAVR